MSRDQLWTRAADAMRADDDPRWHAVADVLRGEAILWAEQEPFVDLFNAAIEQKSGAKSYIRFARTESGEVQVQLDNSDPITRAALIYLGEQSLADESDQQEASDE